eukprot:TRINITY_DN36280_c0_g2_i2.p1 TRINITY_DN36280_c0_g2~~TRINITY_DN36280_c0_g2_i2.p1  ORF type:complete len:376 (+),score=49.90 TRINITY_DN36280_c0_g2_i2:145-1272(+)
MAVAAPFLGDVPAHCVVLPTEGLRSLCTLAACCGRIQLIDNVVGRRDGGRNMSLAAESWRAVALGASHARKRRSRAILPSALLRKRRYVDRFDEVSDMDPLAAGATLRVSDVAVLHLPGAQLGHALKRHGKQIQRYAVLVEGDSQPSTVEPTDRERWLSEETSWEKSAWREVDGGWPRGVRVLRRLHTSADTAAEGVDSRIPGGDDEKENELRIAFVSVIGDGGEFKHNLGLSSVYKDRARLPHVWLLIEKTRQQPLSLLFTELRERVEEEHPECHILLFLHADLWLPDSFEPDLVRLIKRLTAFDPNWAFAGFFGVPLDWQPEPPEWHWKRPRLAIRKSPPELQFRRTSKARREHVAIRCGLATGGTMSSELSL